MNRRDLVKTFGIATTALVAGEALPTTREDDPFMALRQSNLSYDCTDEELSAFVSLAEYISEIKFGKYRPEFVKFTALGFMAHAMKYNYLWPETN